MPSFLKKSQDKEVIAAIDLGSNALRAIIATYSDDTLEIIKTIRVPLRLGEDVFRTGRISAEKMQLTEEAFIEIFHSFVEYNVTNVRATATSAMRDSYNGKILSQKIFQSTGIEIEIISGSEEANIILNAVQGQINLSKKTSMLMDIGGGSTELTIVDGGKILACHSFDVGTVRLLSDQSNEELKRNIDPHIQKMMTFIKHHLPKKRPDLFIGTGGNLRRIGKIRKKILGKSSEFALLTEIIHMEDSISSMTYVDRLRSLELDQNRADVILPAIMITRTLMEKLSLAEIHLPKVGLKEGVLLSLLDKNPKHFILKD